MNANELAEILEGDSKHTSGRFTYSSRYIADIATMLRQQQAELEHMRSFFGCDPAYYGMTKSHPVKELTDEEIDFIFFDLPSGHSIQEFARAILRKAQEK